MIASLHDRNAITAALRHELSKWSIVLLGFGFFLCQPSRCATADICDSSPCLHGGRCSASTPNNYTCVCTANYFGDNCESHNCKGEPCKNGAYCVPCPNSFFCESGNDRGFVCRCPEGRFTGPLCSFDTNECEQLPAQFLCQNGGTCVNTFGGYTCSCVAGYTGTDCGKVLFNSTTATHISPSLEIPSASLPSSLHRTGLNQDFTSMPSRPMITSPTISIVLQHSTLSPLSSEPFAMSSQSEYSTVVKSTTELYDTMSVQVVESSMISTSTIAAESMSSVIHMTSLSSTFSSVIKPSPTRTSPAISLPINMEQSNVPIYATTLYSTVLISPTPYQPQFAIPGAASSKLTSGLLDPFILSVVGTAVLFLVMFAIFLIYKRYKVSKYSTSFDKVSNHMEMSGKQEGNSYVYSPSIPDMSLSGESSTTFTNPTAYAPPNYLVTRRATIGVTPNVAQTEEPAYPRQMSFSGSLRKQRQNQIPPVTFWEGHPNEVVYENPAMLEEEMNQTQQVPGLLVPESVRERPPSAVFAIPPPPPLEELAEQHYPMSPSSPPPEVLYEELELYDPPYSNTQITAVGTNVQLGQGQGWTSHFAPNPSGHNPVVDSHAQGWQQYN